MLVLHLQSRLDASYPGLPVRERRELFGARLFLVTDFAAQRQYRGNMGDKWGRHLFTAGAAVLVLMGIVHSLSLFQPLEPKNETEKQLLDLRSNYRFDLMGSMRSMDNLLRGFSISFMLGMFVMGAFDLSLCRERAGLLKRVALTNTIWLVAMTALSLRYFFAVPTSFLVVALLIFVLAWMKLRVEKRG